MLIYVKLFLTAVFWGGTFVAGRAIAGRIDPFSAAFLRFALASVFLLLAAWKVEGQLPKPSKQQVMIVLLLGITGVFAYNALFFTGLQHIDAGRAAVIIANNPIGIALLSLFFFKERLSMIQIVGIILSVMGALTAITRGNLFANLTGYIGMGELFIFGCVASWVAFSLIGKKITAELSPLVSIAYASSVGTLLLLWPAFSEGLLHKIGAYSTMDWLNIIYLGILGTVFGFVWYYEGIKKIGPTRASIFINFVPISAIVIAFFILSESLTPSLFVGTLLVVTGVYLTNTFRLNQ